MKRYWAPYAAKINALSLRERMLVAAATAACVVMLAKLALFDPLSSKEKIAIDKIAEQQKQIEALQGPIQEMTGPRLLDRSSKARARVQTLRNSIAQIDANIIKLQSTLVAPDQMAQLLEQVLARNGRVELIALRTLPVSNLTSPKEKDQPDKGGSKVPAIASPSGTGKPIYEHGVQITLKGSYADVVNYLTQLELLPSRMFWGKLTMSVDEYPKSLFIVTLYTLSFDQSWLVV